MRQRRECIQRALDSTVAFADSIMCLQAGAAQRTSLHRLRLCGAPLGISPLPAQGDSP
uniref:Uncharacterized protein n=1 Tax=blood disease bacterium R229 TaxID=741978 RepID=G2ZNV5_9RALS|nr:hypothetical protein BDB_110162 [blood disease bacterium R229]